MTDEREELYRDYVSTAQDWQDTLNDYNSEIGQEFADWWDCQECNTLNPPSAANCEMCGTPTEYPRCPACGDVLQPPVPHSCDSEKEKQP